jgi:hypothetical protein
MVTAYLLLAVSLTPVPSILNLPEPPMRVRSYPIEGPPKHTCVEDGDQFPWQQGKRCCYTEHETILRNRHGNAIKAMSHWSLIGCEPIQ